MKGELLKINKNRCRSAKQPESNIYISLNTPTNINGVSRFTINSHQNNLSRLHSRLIKTAEQGTQKTKKARTSFQLTQNNKQEQKKIKTMSVKHVILENHLSIESDWSINWRLKNQLKNLGQVQKQELVDQEFENQFIEIKRHSRFKNTLSGKNQLIFLKPHMKYNCKLPPQQFKTALYHEINTSFSLQTDSLTKNNLNSTINQPHLIQYLTQYDPTLDLSQKKNNRKQKIEKKRIKYSNILREKIRSHYKQSQYQNKIKMIKESKIQKKSINF